MSERDGHTNRERNWEEPLPAGAIADQAQRGIDGVVDFFAGKTPEWRFPQDGVFAPKREFAEGAINDESRRDGNQDSCVAAEVVAGDIDFHCSAERQVDAESRDYEEDDYRRSAEDD